MSTYEITKHPNAISSELYSYLQWTKDSNFKPTLESLQQHRSLHGFELEVTSEVLAGRLIKVYQEMLKQSRFKIAPSRINTVIQAINRYESIMQDTAEASIKCYTNRLNAVIEAIALTMRESDTSWCRNITEENYMTPAKEPVLMSDLLLILLRWAKSEDYSPTIASARKVIEDMYCPDMTYRDLMVYFCTAYHELMDERRFQTQHDRGVALANLVVSCTQGVSLESKTPAGKTTLTEAVIVTSMIEHIGSAMRNSNMDWCNWYIFPEKYSKPD